MNKDSAYYGDIIKQLAPQYELSDDPQFKKEFEEIVSLYELKRVEEQSNQTEPSGVSGAIVRGVAPVAAGAAAGALMAAPTGVGIPVGAAAGAGSVMLTQLIGNPLMTGINAILGTNYATPTEAVQGYLTQLGVSEPDTEAERILQTLSQGATEAFSGAKIADVVAKGATSPATRETAEQLAQAPLQQLVAGGTSAGAAQTTAELGGGPLTQLGAALGGGYAGGKLAGIRAQTEPSNLPGDIREAENLGIPVMTTDVVPPTTFAGRWLKSLGEKVPVAGTGGLRASQQEARVQAVRDYLREFDADNALDMSPQMMDDLLKTRGAAIKKYTDMKRGVLENLDDTPVTLDRTNFAIDSQIEYLKGLKSEKYQPVIAMLTDWKQALNNQGIRNVEQLRKDVGKVFDAPDLASVKDTGQKVLNSIYRPLKLDIEDHIVTQGGQRELNKWRIANKRLSEEAGELDNRSFARLLSQGAITPEKINNWLFSKKPSEVAQLYRNLSPEGKAMGKVALLRRAASKALGVERLEMGDLQTLSPSKFIAELKRLGSNTDIFFRGGDLDQLKGLIRALDLTKGASQSNVVVKTGEQATLPVVTAFLGNWLGAVPAITAVGGFGGIARLYESAPVRNALLKINQTLRGSAEELEAVKRLQEAIRAEQAAIEREEKSKQ